MAPYRLCHCKITNAYTILQIRYEVYNNCNFTEIGEPFAEQPYAVAVQQGSHLMEEISKVILMLQKDRYFEMLSSKYWNSTMRSSCPILDDSEGITIGSLGTLFRSQKSFYFNINQISIMGPGCYGCLGTL